MPKKKEEEEKKDVSALLKKLQEEKEELEKKLEGKEVAEKKVTDPMSGPGVLCQATEITPAESWQLPMRERLSPISQTPEMISDPVPEGMSVKKGPNNSQYVVFPDNPDLIPNCKSKYTREYWVYGKKPAEDRGNMKKEPPKVTLHLCEHHANIFNAHEKRQKQEV